MKERFKIIPEVFLVLMQDGKILLSRRFQTGFEDGNYGMVAGHAEAHETMREGASREAREEAGIVVDPEKLRHLLTMHRSCGDHERIGFYFTIDTWEGEIKNMEPHRCDDLRWFPVDTLPENTIPHIRKAVECILNGTHYIEFEWPGK